jgi:hypothetical protein
LAIQPAGGIKRLVRRFTGSAEDRSIPRDLEAEDINGALRFAAEAAREREIPLLSS